MRPPDELVAGIAGWLREYAAGAGAAGYILGLSGGIDSAVTAALCKEAMGDAVLALLMPIHSAPEDAELARLVADTLDIDTIDVDLTPAYDTLTASLPEGQAPIALANVKPRLRMTTLYTLGQTRGYLVAGTGNRSELMVGYFTKYGDGGADVLPLGDLYKTQVREVARTLGVPEPVIARAPSAGLWAGQTDEDELGMTYEELDRVLAAIEAGDTTQIDPPLLARVELKIAATAHKRNTPPIYYA